MNWQRLGLALILVSLSVATGWNATRPCTVDFGHGNPMTWYTCEVLFPIITVASLVFLVWFGQLAIQEREEVAKDSVKARIEQAAKRVGPTPATAIVLGALYDDEG